MKQVGNTILAKGGNHILAKRDNSAWPKGSKLSGFSNTGGYVDIEEKTYNEIVSAKHEQAKSIALLFYTGICAEDGKLTSRNIESLFKILQYECRYNYKETRKRVLNFKSYK